VACKKGETYKPTYWGKKDNNPQSFTIPLPEAFYGAMSGETLVIMGHLTAVCTSSLICSASFSILSFQSRLSLPNILFP
jgi:hypothetical protein